MAATPTRTYRVFIALAPHGGDGDIASLLDMLRYEAATVQSWSRGKDARDRSGYWVEFTTAHAAPDRWASFGIASERIA